MTQEVSLSTRVFHKWLIPSLSEWLIIICLFAIGYRLNNVAVWFLVTVLLGSRQHALGVLGHDSAHFAASRSKRVNDLSAELLCFWPLCTGLGDFRQFHLNHHRFFDTDKDPELIFKSWNPERWALPITRTRLMFYFCSDIIGGGIPEVSKAYRLLGKTSLRSWLGPMIWWLLIGATLVKSGLGLIVVVWFSALVSSFWAFFRLRTWTEHVGTDSTHRVQANWWQRFLITPHGSWSHCEHHTFPAVPFWKRSALRVGATNVVSMDDLCKSLSETTAESQRELRLLERDESIRV
jgi:fatty acid desaturase